MKKLRLKEIILLFLPVIFMAGFAIFLQNPRGDGSLTVVKTEIRPATAPNDTEVHVVVKYASPSPFPEFITRPNYTGIGLGVFDSKGKQVSLTSSGAGIGPEGNYLYGFWFYFPMSQVPKSAGKLTVKALVGVKDKTLPLSVVVRK